MRVDSYMSQPVTAHPQQDCLSACQLMQKRAVSHVPVASDDASVLGVLSRHDVRRAASRFHTAIVAATAGTHG